MAGPRKTKHRATVWHSSRTPEHTPGENYNLKRHVRAPQCPLHTIHNSHDVGGSKLDVRQQGAGKDAVPTHNGALLSSYRAETAPSRNTDGQRRPYHVGEERISKIGYK